jgi:hypothetical protein
MDKQGDIIRDTQALHSDMQTLVYENYNKFISATDTIRKVSGLLDVLLLSGVFFFVLNLFLIL